LKAPVLGKPEATVLPLKRKSPVAQAIPSRTVDYIGPRRTGTERIAT